MKNFNKHYNSFKALLLNAEKKDTDTLRKEYEKCMNSAMKDTDLYNFNDMDRDVISAMSHKVQRIHSLGHLPYHRNEETQLTAAY